MSAEVKNLLYPQALEKLLAAVSEVSCITVPTVDAAGYVLAEDIKTPRPFPDTRRSAVDGYALGSIDATSLELIDTLAAEDLPRGAMPNKAAVAVMTGATVPHSAKAVARVEDVRSEGRLIFPPQGLQEGENINNIGEEAGAGELVLQQGRYLDAVAHSVLCYLGVSEVRVYRRLKIGIMVTGNELLRPGQKHRPGMVYEANSFLLSRLLRQMGCEVDLRGPVADSPAVISQVLKQLGEENDLVVTSGGVSMGKFDYIRPLLEQSGFELLVDRTRIKPGRPLLVARRDGQLFFGMPGYPAAFLVNSFVYLLPVLRKLSGRQQLQPDIRLARLGEGVKGRLGRWDMIRVGLQYEGAELYATPLKSQLTSHFINMAACHGLVTLAHDCEALDKGEQVRVIDFSAALR